MTSAHLDPDRTRATVERLWDDSIVPALTEFIRIPNKSPLFDPEWEAHGHMDRAADLVADWCQAHAVPGTTVEIVRLPGRTPVVLIESPGARSPDGAGAGAGARVGAGADDDTVLLYGHLDKQPEMTGWDEDLGPWTPVLRDGRLYGRGGADDGYAAFACIAALRVLHEQGVPHQRAVVLIEGSEESGSPDLPAYIEHLGERIGNPSLVVCLDSGCGNYEQLWLTTSLRGIVVGTLRVDILEEGVHSGHASGIVPSSFRILRQLLDRIEDPETGRCLIDAAHVEVPAGRLEEARLAADALGDEVAGEYPFFAGAGPGERPGDSPVTELLLDRSWRPTLSITGADGIPPIADAGNVLRPHTAVRLSIRTPPTADTAAVVAALREVLESEAPYGARVEVAGAGGADGWDSPALAPWLESSLQAASQTYFGGACLSIGQGGSIPFMAMLAERFPQAQFVITGVLGPGSNAHGPNEFLHVGMGKGVTCCVAQVLADHHAR